MTRVVILGRSSSTYGLAKDSKWVEQVLRECHATRSFTISTIHHQDPMSYTPPKQDKIDIQIHLEEPCRLAWPWAKINVVVVNPEWWPKTAWDWALAAADRVVFKDVEAAALFPEVSADRRIVLGWRGPSLANSKAAKGPAKILYVLGGSVNKVAAAKVVVAAWKPDWPCIEIRGAPAALEALKPCVTHAGAPITWVAGFRDEADLAMSQKGAAIHCVASAAEGFGHTMAEAIAAGALPLWTDIPAYKATWGPVFGTTGMIRTRPDSEPVLEGDAKRQGRYVFGSEDVEDALHSLLRLTDEEREHLVVAAQRRLTERVTEWRQGWRSLLKGLTSLLKNRTVPTLPRLDASELPKVAVITVTRNRPGWFHNMSRNVLKSDYPHEKLLWVIVDDGDFVMGGSSGASGRLDMEVARFQEKCPHIRVEYVSLPKPLPVGAKRNRGCAAALRANPDIEIFAMMDDDDHYPAGSLQTRVANIRALKVECVYCSRIPMYDCKRYISAMNVPPMTLAPAERVSEATLTFTRSFWESRGFPGTVSIAEGEEFIKGREALTAETAPEGIIVSFLHGGNTTSRRVPAAQEPNGCHYGFDDTFFSYLCRQG